MPAEDRRLAIARDVRELRRMSEWIARRCDSLGVSTAVRENLDVCANEAVANVILHAADALRDGEIALVLDRDGSDVMLEITDDGAPFDPLSTESRATVTSLDDAEIGGLGLPLIRGLLPRSRYARIGARNVLTLVSAVEG